MTSCIGPSCDNHAYVPHAIPWHMREAPPPAGLREGSWMVDLAIDRLNDHCRFANERHIWVLPWRLHLEKAFKVEWQDKVVPLTAWVACLPVTRSNRRRRVSQ
jgi:hypothetical protein